MLVAVSGSTISMTLLDLAADLPNHSFVDKPTVGHVDVSACFESRSAEKNKQFLDELHQICASYQLNLEIIALEDVFADSETVDRETRRERLRGILRNATTLTAKEDIYSYLVRAALILLAKRLKFVANKKKKKKKKNLLFTFCGSGYHVLFWAIQQLI